MKMRNFWIIGVLVIGLFVGMVGMSLADSKLQNSCASCGKGSSCQPADSIQSQTGNTQASSWERINRGQ